MKVCEMCCGTGMEIGKWDRAKVGQYVGIDASPTSLHEARERWTQKSQPFPAHFAEIDPFTENIDAELDRTILFDIVCCFEGLQHSFATEAKLRSFLYNVSVRLKPGGFFFGMLPDSSEIWYKSQKVTSGLPLLKGALYSVEFPKDDFQAFGTLYTFKLGEGTITEYLVHFPSLLKLAKEYNLQMITIQNFQEFYEDHRKNYGDKLKALGVLDKKAKIQQNQMEIIGLFTTFVFVKAYSN